MAGDWGQELINKGLISKDQVRVVKQFVASSRRGDFKDVLLELGYVTDENIGRAHAAQLGYRSINLEETEISPDALQQMPESIARKYTVFAVATEGYKLTVAMTEAMNYEVIEHLRFQLNREIVVVLASQEAILAAIDKHYPESSEVTPEEYAQILSAYIEEYCNFPGMGTEAIILATDPHRDDRPPTMPVL
ncbi:MAG: hypothetical protein V4719_11815 [Planctomycetota bacterium]